MDFSRRVGNTHAHAFDGRKGARFSRAQPGFITGIYMRCAFAADFQTKILMICGWPKYFSRDSVFGTKILRADRQMEFHAARPGNGRSRQEEFFTSLKNVMVARGRVAGSKAEGASFRNMLYKDAIRSTASDKPTCASAWNS